MHVADGGRPARRGPGRRHDGAGEPGVGAVPGPAPARPCTVGVGAVSGVSAEEVLAAVDAVLPPGSAGVRLATLDVRAAEPGIAAAAARRGWPLTGYASAELAQVPVRSPSDRVAELVGTGSVAEAAALLGGGTLVVGKTVVGRVTVAVSA